MVRAFRRRLPSSQWDQMLARHQREREEVLRWDDATSRSRSLKRSSSTKTLRRDKGGEPEVDPMFTDGDVPPTDDEGGSESDMDSVVAKWKGKGRMHEPTSSADSSPRNPTKFRTLVPSDVTDTEWEDWEMGSSYGSPSSAPLRDELEGGSHSETGSQWDTLEGSPASATSSPSPSILSDWDSGSEERQTRNLE